MSKKNLAVIFGGRSSEHEVSCISVVTVAKAVDTEKYNISAGMSAVPKVRIKK